MSHAPRKYAWNIRDHLREEEEVGDQGDGVGEQGKLDRQAKTEILKTTFELAAQTS